MNGLIRKICDAIKKTLHLNEDSENGDQNNKGLGVQVPDMFY